MKRMHLSHSNFSCRRGSALLIVIGMLTFIIVSSVSFAIFMRQGRAPSSYLRRNSSARYLLKAGLANAIARLDGSLATYAQLNDPNINKNTTDRENGLCEGVYDDAYPGVGPSQNLELKYNGDYWLKRVFMPFGETATDNTVSTLTLEGLAYLPPAIINEVRVYARRTRTAVWRHLPYDTGRYAFCAVDVSDCFDINKMCAEGRRFSSSGDRITLASLFPETAEDLEKILVTCSNHEDGGDANIPFVSVADFNIVAGGIDKRFTPFCNFIGQAGNQIYDCGADDYVSASNALFITDTWFPPTNVTTTVKRIDLETDDGQPFTQAQYEQDKPTILSIIPKSSGGTSLGKALVDRIGIMGMCCLYDYLDGDSRPISLCVPSVEAAPMVCELGVALNKGLKPKVGALATLSGTYDSGKPDPNNPGANLQYTRTATKYGMLTLGKKICVTGAFLFPHRRLADKKYERPSHEISVLVKGWWGLEPCWSRLPDNPAMPIKYENANVWKESGSVTEGIVTVGNLPATVKFDLKDEPKEAKEAIGTFETEPFDLPDPNAPMFWYVEEKDENGKDVPGTPYYSLDGIANKSDALVARASDGTMDKWWSDIVLDGVGPDPVEAKICDGKTWTDTFKHKAGSLNDKDRVLHLAVWVKLETADGVVDLVPARILDDKIFGLGDNSGVPGVEGLGKDIPILEFRGTDCRFTYSKAGVEKLDGTDDNAEEFSQSWDRICCVDPRYNWAPENWFCQSGRNGDVTVDDWVTIMGADDGKGVSGSPFTESGSGYDHDIFMFASDQEMLQSMGELMFLPDVGWSSDGTKVTMEELFAEKLSNGGFAGASMGDRKKWTDCACADIAWKTYSAEDGIFNLGGKCEIHSGQNGFCVNPFSPDIRVMMAALSETPYDYYAASPRGDSESPDKDAQLNAFASEEYDPQKWTHAFNKNGSVAKMGDDVLREIGERMSESFRSAAKKGNSNWQSIYDDLAWFDGKVGPNQLSFLGVELDKPLFGVDRKFLYSFWRECFQNRQQLFLVFVRAEPLTVGGMGEGSLAAAQLGARGVALVWRDPQPPARGERKDRNLMTSKDMWKTYYEDCAPHRTRVLFYHQFD